MDQSDATAKRFFEERDISGGYFPAHFIVDDFGRHEGILTNVFNGRLWSKFPGQNIKSFLEDNDPLIVEVVCSFDQTPDYRCNGNLLEMDHMPEELCQTMTM